MASSASASSRGFEADEKGPSASLARSRLPAAYREYASVVASLAASPLDPFDRPLGTGAMERAHLRRWLGRASLRRTGSTPRSSHPSPPRIWTLLIGLWGLEGGA